MANKEAFQHTNTPDNPENPLVTVLVITYNSAKYVLETLQSAYDQTYQTLELVISDDCSKDNTLRLCEEWIKENGDRFLRTHIVRSMVNTGIPSNINRGLAEVRGLYYKSIAGDDILLPNCIQDNVAFAEANASDLVASIRLTFSGSSRNPKIIGRSTPKLFLKGGLNAKQQYALSLRHMSPSPNTLFRRTAFIRNIGGFDEEFPLIEDWPMMIRMTKAGGTVHFLDKETVLYRQHEKSTWRSEIEKKIHTKWSIKSSDKVFKKYVWPEVGKYERLLFLYKHNLKKFIYHSKVLNRRNTITSAINHILLAPHRFLMNLQKEKIKRKIRKNII